MRSPRTSRRWSLRSQQGSVRLGLAALAPCVILLGLLAPWGQTAAALDESDGYLWEQSIEPYEESLVSVAVSNTNFCGSVVDDAARTFVLQGVGDPGPDILSAMETAPANVTVSWQRVPYSAAELEAAAYSAMSDTNVITSYENDDCSGVVAEVDSSSNVDLPLLRRQLRTLNDGVPIDIQAGYPDEPLQSRSKETSPFDGGDHLSIVPNAECSDAVEVLNPQGKPAMLTAAHCADWGQPNYKTYMWDGPGTTAAFKSGTTADVVLDAQLLFPINGSETQRYVWRGPWDTTEDRYVDRGIVIPPPLHWHFCVSGGVSGGTRAGTVAARGVYKTYQGDPTHLVHGPYFELRNLESDRELSGPGDSGSPVLRDDPSDGTFRFAGVVVAGPTEGPWMADCVGYPEFRNGCAKGGLGRILAEHQIIARD